MTRLNFHPKVQIHRMHYYSALLKQTHYIGDYLGAHQFGAEFEVKGFQTIQKFGVRPVYQ